MALGRGGRTYAELIGYAVAQADREDAILAAREAREGPRALAHIDVAEPTISGPVSETRRAILARSRRWREWRARQAAADAARAELEDQQRLCLSRPVPVPSPDERAPYVSPESRRWALRP